MGLYTGNRWFEEETQWLREDAIGDLLKDDKKSDDKGGDSDKKEEKAKDPAKIGKKSDKYKEDDDKEKEVTNPSIECGQYLVTLNLKTKKVEIEDTQYDNEVKLTFDEFKKIAALYRKTDTRPDKRPDPMGGGASA